MSNQCVSVCDGPQGVCNSCQEMMMMMNGAYAFVCFCSCRFDGPLTVACRDKLPVELESGKFDIRFGS